MPRHRNTPFVSRRPTHATALVPLALSGSNPGNLAGHTYVPDTAGDRPALVVVLHGCTQTAAGYDHGSGWSALAERHGFVLLFPEQQRANNPNLCFNWFEPNDITRDRGEIASIREMIAQVAAEQQVDPDRIFITGLSAGGAMAAAMLAAYPEIFAAGAIIAGLPYGSSSSVTEALGQMRNGPMVDDEMLAERVRQASSHEGRWPRLSVWHGSADRTVSAINAEALVRQWVTLHDLPAAPTRLDHADGQPRRVWCGPDGTELIEDRLIAGMGHGTPVAPGDDEKRGGVAGAFMLDVGISSSHAIASFWNILDAEPRRARVAEPARPTASVEMPGRHAADPAPRRMEVIGRSRRPAASPPPMHGGVQGVIENALRSAGLMK
ncbi:MAG: hypothetical protein JWM38_2288 [Sphingomonas bacterium]|nr:hypothetical protein [Sphingomonas bacterium]